MKQKPLLARLLPWLPAILMLCLGVPAVMWMANESLYESIESDDYQAQQKAFYLLSNLKNDRSDAAILKLLITVSAQPYQVTKATRYNSRENVYAGLMHITLRELSERKVRGAIEPALLILNRDYDAQILGTSVCALGMYGDADFYSIISARATHPDALLRKKVIKALMNIDHPEVVATLLSMAFNDRSEAVRKLALSSVALIGNVRAVGPLLKVARSTKNINDRLEYIATLGELGVIEAEEALAQLVSSDDAVISRKAKQTLATAAPLRGRDTRHFFERKPDRCFYVY